MTAKRLHPYRQLTDAPLTEEDWRAVYLAQQAFTYQIQRIVADAEGRERPERVVRLEDAIREYVAGKLDHEGRCIGCSLIGKHESWCRVGKLIAAVEETPA